MERLGPDLLRLSSSGSAAVHLIAAATPTLIDAGAPGRGAAIERELRALGIHPRRVVLTHGDPDHAGGSDHLRRAFDAEVVAAAAERPLIDRSGWPNVPQPRRTLMKVLFGRTRPPTIDRWIDPGAGLELDGVRILAAPGHTPGHIVVEWADWLLAGDSFVTSRLNATRFGESLGIFTMDRATARRTIEMLAARRPVAASSSHGRPARDATRKLEALVASWR